MKVMHLLMLYSYISKESCSISVPPVLTQLEESVTERAAASSGLAEFPSSLPIPIPGSQTVAGLGTASRYHLMTRSSDADDADSFEDEDDYDDDVLTSDSPPPPPPRPIFFGRGNLMLLHFSFLITLFVTQDESLDVSQDERQRLQSSPFEKRIECRVGTPEANSEINQRQEARGSLAKDRFSQLAEELDLDERWFPLLDYLSTFGFKDSHFIQIVENSLKPTVTYLIEEVGIEKNDLAKVVQLSPQILVQRIDTSWTARFNFLTRELGAPRE
ncbi:hypothetical protein HAX54_014559 [Datura stramonium]|uniref:Uncharacterized protein n=1 Tax=Datura stramonium TaxID=4076 RepID=A0ABS8Y7J2_DATST|nr:hypothetical protein [Datura stramonium]